MNCHHCHFPLKSEPKREFASVFSESISSSDKRQESHLSDP